MVSYSPSTVKVSTACVQRGARDYQGDGNREWKVLLSFFFCIPIHCCGVFSHWTEADLCAMAQTPHKSAYNSDRCRRSQWESSSHVVVVSFLPDSVCFFIKCANGSYVFYKWPTTMSWSLSVDCFSSQLDIIQMYLHILLSFPTPG